MCCCPSVHYTHLPSHCVDSVAQPTRADSSMEPGQYQQLEVGERLPVRRFVEGEGLEFSPGRAFYQLTKKETVQDRAVNEPSRSVTGKGPYAKIITDGWFGHQRSLQPSVAYDICK